MACSVDHWQRIRQRPAPFWLTRLQHAERASEVLAVARDFVATWEPEDLARLPSSCLPGALKDAEQVVELAYLLKTEQLTRISPRDDEAEVETIQQFAFFFELAAIRLARLARAH